MIQPIEELSREANETLSKVETATQLEEWRVAYLGRKGKIPQLLRGVKELPVEERKKIGAEANALRQELEEAYESRKQEIENQKPERDYNLQPTTYNLEAPGHLHPLTLTIRRIQSILSAMGFLMVEGPEVEEARYNFDQLNIPLEHPARAETDTFYIDTPENNLVLRTHTSPVQVRAVLENDLTPPFNIMSIGRVFRAEKTDATHETTFYQVEALSIGQNITVADYKGITEALFTAFFNKKVTVRLRPSYFPFVEPGFEPDLSCVFCEGKGCKICKYTGWIEIGGAGMVHPNVLKNMNVDPSNYQGFAFGYGIDRLMMLKHGVNDVRLSYSGDVRFLKQFD